MADFNLVKVWPRFSVFFGSKTVKGAPAHTKFLAPIHDESRIFFSIHKSNALSMSATEGATQSTHLPPSKLTPKIFKNQKNHDLLITSR